MQMEMNCWESCAEDFTVEAPDRSDPQLIEGVKVACTHCGQAYIFTVDGDGEPSLDSVSGSLGDNIDDIDAESSTHF